MEELKIRTARSKFKEFNDDTVIKYIKYQKCRHDDIVNLIIQHSNDVSKAYIEYILSTRILDENIYIVMKYINDDLDISPFSISVMSKSDFEKLFTIDKPETIITISKKKKLKLTEQEFADFKELEEDLTGDYIKCAVVEAGQFALVMKMLRCLYENSLMEE